MCGALFRSNKETVFKSEEVELPMHFFIVSCCWVFMCGAWMLWNQEARTFVCRKICKIQCFNIQRKVPKVKQPQILEAKSKTVKISTLAPACAACDETGACPNCIARNIVKKKQFVTQNFLRDFLVMDIPGVVDTT